MVDERFIRRVKYGIVTAAIIAIQIYLQLQKNTSMDYYSRSMLEFFITIVWIFLAYFGIRFLIILFMDRNRFLEAIDILLTRVNNGTFRALDRMAQNSRNSNRDSQERHYHNHYYDNSRDRQQYNERRPRDYDPLDRAGRDFANANRSVSKSMRNVEKNFDNVNRNMDRSLRDIDRNFNNVNRNMDRTLRNMDKGFSSGGSKKKGRKGDFW